MLVLAGGCWQSEDSSARRSVHKLIELVRARFPGMQEAAFASAHILAGASDIPYAARQIIPIEQSDGTQSGFALGTLFVTSQTGMYQPAQSPLDAGCLTRPALAQFMRQFWGKYAAASYDSQQNRLTLLADPAGMQPLFVAHVAGGWLFASDLAILHAALPDATIDWNYFAIALRYSVTLQTSRTPFRDVTEVEPGTAWILQPQASAEVITCWNPAAIISSHPSTSVEDVSHSLKQTFLAWAQHSQGIAVSLSGGLDSSALLALLKTYCPDLPLVAVHTAYEGLGFLDEREIAERVTQHLGVPLIVVNGQDCLPLAPPLYRAEWHNKPTLRLLRLYECQLVAEQVHAAGCDTLVDGEGGDAVFFQPSFWYLGDYLAQSLFAFWREAGAAGRLQATSVYTMLATLRRLAQARAAAPRIGALAYTADLLLPNRSTPAWLCIPASSASSTVSTQLWANLPSLSLRQAVQSAMLYIFPSVLAHEYSLTPPYETLSPLLSTPVVEAALRLPVELIGAQGITRIAWRKIAATLLPHDIAWRRSKGNFIGRELLAARTYQSRMEALLFDGRIAQKGWIDRSRLQQDFRAYLQGNGEHGMTELSSLLAIELWFETWGLS